MPRFSGTPVEKGPRYSGTPVEKEKRGLLEYIPGVTSINDFAESILGVAPQGETAVQGASDAARLGVNAVSLGGADYMADKLAGNTAQHDATQAARDRMGLGGTAVEFGAGALTPTGIPDKIMKAGRVAQTGAHALSAGIQGAADTYMNNPNASWGDIAKSGLTSSGISGAVSGITDPVASWLSRRKSRAKAVEGQTYKTDAELSAAREAKYKKVRESGTVYLNRDIRNLQKEFKALNLHPGLDQRATELLAEYAKRYKGKTMTPDEVDLMRQDIRRTVYTDKYDRDKFNTGRMVEAVDKFTDSAVPHIFDPVKGHYVPAPTDVNQTLKEARDLSAREKRLDVIGEAKREAERTVTRGRFDPFASSPEGATVKKFSDVAKRHDQGKRTFPEAEIEKIRQIEAGTPLRNIGGRMEPYSARGKFGGPIGMAAASMGMVPGVGYLGSAPLMAGMAGAEALSTLGQRQTAQQLEELEALVRDPKGIGLGPIKADPEAVRLAKDRLAKMAASGTRTAHRNRGEN